MTPKPLTIVDIVANIGRTGLVLFGDIRVQCRILSAKQSYGVFRYQVRPISGTGQQWIDYGRIELDKTEHTKDADCTVGPDGTCTVCGTAHGPDCPDCGAKAFHFPSCPHMTDYECQHNDFLENQNGDRTCRTCKTKVEVTHE